MNYILKYHMISWGTKVPGVQVCGWGRKQRLGFTSDV
jgi:hypothetical protein